MVFPHGFSSGGPELLEKDIGARIILPSGMET